MGSLPSLRITQKTQKAIHASHDYRVSIRAHKSGDQRDKRGRNPRRKTQPAIMKINNAFFGLKETVINRPVSIPNIDRCPNLFTVHLITCIMNILPMHTSVSYRCRSVFILCSVRRSFLKTFLIRSPLKIFFTFWPSVESFPSLVWLSAWFCIRFYTGAQFPYIANTVL